MDAVSAVIYRDEPFEVISLDHDYSEFQPTGYDFIRWFINNQPHKLPQVFRIHTANPVGRDNIVSVIVNSGRYPNREMHGIGYSQ
jgi:hypothetical protein